MLSVTNGIALEKPRETTRHVSDGTFDNGCWDVQERQNGKPVQEKCERYSLKYGFPQGTAHAVVWAPCENKKLDGLAIRGKKQTRNWT